MAVGRGRMGAWRAGVQVAVGVRRGGMHGGAIGLVAVVSRRTCLRCGSRKRVGDVVAQRGGCVQDSSVSRDAHSSCPRRHWKVLLLLLLSSSFFFSF